MQICQRLQFCLDSMILLISYDTHEAWTRKYFEILSLKCQWWHMRGTARDNGSTFIPYKQRMSVQQFLMQPGFASQQTKEYYN